MWRRRVDGTREAQWTATAARRVSRLVSRLELRQRVGLQITLDSLALVSGLAAAQTGRSNFKVETLRDPGFWVIVLLAVCLLHFVGTALHLYLGRYRFGGFEEVLSILTSVTLTVIGLEIAVFAFGQPRPIPLSVPPLGGTVTLSIMFGVRYLYRLTEERLRRPAPEGTEPLIVFGAGEGAEQVLAAMLRTPDSPYYPVALLDDDPRCWNLQLHGVRVRGGRDAIAAVARATGATTLLVAIPSADAALLREVTGLAEEAGLAVKVLPRVADLIGGNVDVTDIREIDINDLLGRRQIRTDVATTAGYLAGRRVLVTGAGGSIGSELCRQVHRFGPAELVMLDRDESALRAVQLSLHGHTGLDDDSVVLCDIRDVDMVSALFTERRPEVVFHAAALKHLPLLERFPGESVKTNVWGTLSVLEAAAACGVERLVNISTDKAADPSSVLGYSKRITERLTAHVAAEHRLPYVSVRFGNVLGSNGSVLTIFASQLAAGGPLTVTDAEVSRYFMTVQEAVELVLQAGAIGSGGDVLVLDMGEPVRIVDVAERLATRAAAKTGGQKAEIVYTGLGVGEKLHEALFGMGETDDRPHHPLISEVPVPALDPSIVVELDPWADEEKVRAALLELGRDADLAAVTASLTRIPHQPTSA
ncbi:polysaccharide biosynthesis protein [Frankia sp. AgB1.9]|uniref:nucleoside-diphosphate sugar epimerase/dehydratase n=1 Tax=unclassified Frankia TaxID=2632575 RepID=UPI001931535B|nr:MULTISPECIES: nucleoside-diphosphate sugar epimerase/dehydratase [unclassified Frankia]MBL7490190.1 polysaccharide biosynthesis protein [Frankia sp. AgW1.1]MBL7553379.1 polysaccharide biosynthesis protein [Frankia sp. AgB1.9]MBL7619410.1 polysaccharide biosynthesis protein [Frankia sp. AgB1.8]